MDNSNLYCSLCPTKLDEFTDSAEHIIPNAIGGRLMVRGFICGDCNNRTGTEWDAELATQLSGFSLLLNISRQRGKHQSVVVHNEGGEEIKLHRDGPATYAKGVSVGEPVDGKINIRADKQETADQIIEGLTKKYVNAGATVSPVETEELLEPLQGPVTLQMSIGGDKSFRSIVKTALAFAVHNGTSAKECECAVRYLLEDGEACVSHYGGEDLVSTRQSDILHCVAVIGNPEEGLLLAYVEYFSAFRFVISLSENYQGNRIDAAYAIDPRTAETFELEVNLPFGLEEIGALKRSTISALEALKTRLGRLVPIIYETSVRREFERICLDILADMGIREDQAFSEEQRNEFERRVVRAIPPFFAKEFSNQRKV